MGVPLQTVLVRLRTASLGEILYRIRRVAFLCSLRLRFLGGRVPEAPALSQSRLKQLVLPSLHLDQGGLQLSSRVWTLGADLEQIREFEEKYRKTFFADVSTEGQGVDIRTVWEPARLQHLWILLARAQGEEVNVPARNGRMSDVCDAVAQWLKDNPFLAGPHYESAMECALRIPLFLFCLKADISDGALVQAIYRHGWLIFRRLSLYSSLGNHTVTEAVGLVFAGTAFCEQREGMTWLQCGMRLLRQEVSHQILDDGGPAEQSTSYHRFVLDLYWLVVDFVEKNKIDDCADIKERLMLGEEFLAAIHAGGNTPAIGDSDDGYALAPGVCPARPELTLQDQRYRCFEDSGYSLTQLDNGVVFTFDHGPLGMSPLFNHGHADALSITMRCGGKHILVDPGTYVYNGQPDWRRYFKGTASHNTVTIDGQDQARQLTSFAWAEPYQCELIAAREICSGLLIVAEHDGYQTLSEPATHRRELLLNEDMLLIRDSFKGDGEHSFELNFHFHPDCDLSSTDGVWNVRQDDFEFLVRMFEPEERLHRVYGSMQPRKGWYSPSYSCKHPCSVLSCEKKGSPSNVVFVTALIFNREVSDVELQRMHGTLSAEVDRNVYLQELEVT